MSESLLNVRSQQPEPTGSRFEGRDDRGNDGGGQGRGGGHGRGGGGGGAGNKGTGNGPKYPGPSINQRLFEESK
jgi:hypothetical protein